MRASAAATAASLAACLAVLAGCSHSSARGPRPAAAVLTPLTPAWPAGSPPSSGLPVPSASALPEPAPAIDAASLVGIGALTTRYAQRHAGRADGYGPGRSFDQVRVVAFARSFAPGLPRAEVLDRLRADLPADARVAADLHPSAACEQVWWTSGLLHIVLDPHVYVIAQLTGTDPVAFDPGAVTAAVLDVDVSGGPGSVGC